MDVASTSSPSIAVIVPKPAMRRRITWPGASSIPQNFSLPSSIIYYMAKNPSSPIVYNKLIQSCKYFFEKNPILVIADIYGPVLKICSNEECIGGGRCCIVIGNNKSITTKLWITHGLCLNFTVPENLTSSFRPKVYRCDVVEFITWDIHILYDDFKFFASSVFHVNLENVQISYGDGKPVPLEDIIETIPKIKKFVYIFCKKCPVTSASTMKTIAKLMNPEQLEFFRLIKIPFDAFNVDDLSVFIHDYKNTKICLAFISPLPAEYKAQLDVLVDTIIASKTPSRFIQYDGQDEEKHNIMRKRFKLF